MRENPAFVFSPQGTQKVGMGEDFYDRYKSVSELYDRAEQLLIDWGWGANLRQLCFDGPQEQLNHTERAQPALFVFESAVSKILRERNVRPSEVSGHSFGMFPAYFAAGVLTFDEGLRLAFERGRIMAQAGEENPGGMTAVKESMQRVEGLIQQSNIEDVWGVNDNSPAQAVIAGRQEALERFQDFLKQFNIKYLRLPVSIAGHSPLMESAAHKLQVAVSKVNFQEPVMQVMLDTRAEFVYSAHRIKEEIVRQLTSRVMWVDCVRNMAQSGVTDFIEIGPKDTLSGFIKKIDDRVHTYQVSDLASLEETLSALA